MNTAAILVCAMLLDALLGEPDWLWKRWPHPAVLIGRGIGWLETRLNHGRLRRAKGILTLALLILISASLGWVLSLGGPLVAIPLVAILLAQKSLVSHVHAVADGLRRSVADGRRSVTMIVSRDVAQMEAPIISRAAIESGAENLSDGVIAPAFWFLVAGLPGLLIYKAVNTADSMTGYLNERYAEYGWAAAKTDDLLNLIPARLTAVLIALPGGVVHQWQAIIADARLHRSPNAGWPEAAMARAIDVALSGPRAYDGRMRCFPWVNEAGKQDTGPQDIDAAIRLLWQAWGFMLIAVLILGLLFS